MTYMKQHSKCTYLLPQLWRKSEAAWTSDGGPLMCKPNLESNSLSSRCRENISLIQFVWVVQSNTQIVENRGTAWQMIPSLLLASLWQRKAWDAHGPPRHPAEAVPGGHVPGWVPAAAMGRGFALLAGPQEPTPPSRRPALAAGRARAPAPRGHAEMLQPALPEPASWRGPTHAGTFP